MRLSLRLIATAFGVAALAGAAHAAVIVNGDFTNPNVGGGYGQFATIPGWFDTSDTLEVGASSVYGLPCETAGCQNLEVNANTFDTVSQTVTGLTVGETYDLSWDYGGRNGGGPQQLDVFFGGVQIATDTSNGVNAFWTPNEVSVIASGSSETLTFQSVNVGGTASYGNELTGVSIAVPEPAAWALMLLGFAGLGAALRTRRGSLCPA
jgi:hypothetical protein